MTEDRKLECPSCSRPIFNRRLPDCEFCGAPLPEELLMKEEEQDAIHEERTTRDALQRQRDRVKEREDRRRRRDSGDAAFFP